MKNYLVLILNIFSFSLCLAQKAERFSDFKSVIRPNQFKIDISQKNAGNKAVVNFQLFKKSAANGIKSKVPVF